jgi:hypothetical protein
MRPYFHHPHLLAGRIHWPDRAAALAAQTELYFRKLRDWVNREWDLLPDSDVYVGSQAKELIAKGAQLVNCLPAGHASYMLIYE